MRSFRFLMLGPALAAAGFACGSQEVDVDVPAPVEQAQPGEAMQQQLFDEQIEGLRQGRERMMQEMSGGAAAGNPTTPSQ